MNTTTTTYGVQVKTSAGWESCGYFASKDEANILAKKLRIMGKQVRLSTRNS